MSLIFSTQFHKGSYIDQVSKTAGTPTDVEFKRTEKGTAIETKGENDSFINFSSFSPTNAKAWVAWIKFEDVSVEAKTAFILSGSNMTLTFSPIGGASLIGGEISVQQRRTIYDFKAKIWYQLVCNYDSSGVPYLYVNTEESTYGTNSYTLSSDDSLYIGRREDTSKLPKAIQLAKLEFHDAELTTLEIQKDYQDFLQSGITEKPIRGFEYPKPTDLSYEDGLVAAYSPSKDTVIGGQLLDISGNSNHGTISGVMLTKDGMKFDGVDDWINCGNDTSLRTTNNLTILTRIKADLPKTGSYSKICGRFDSGDNKRVWWMASGSAASRKLNVRLYPLGTTTGLKSYKSSIDVFDNLEHTVGFTFKDNILKIYIDGVEDTAVTKVTDGTITTLFDTDISLTLGTTQSSGGPNEHLNGEIIDFRQYGRVLNDQEIKDYHNSFITPQLIEDFSNHPVGDTSPKGWQKGTGAFVIQEDTTRKFLTCTSNGTITIPLNLDAFEDNAAWTTYTDTLANLISTHAWLSYANGRLTFTMNDKDRLGSVTIYNGVKV